MGMLKFELHTDLLYIVNMCMYEVCYEYDIEHEELADIMVEEATPIITNAIKEILPKAIITIGEFNHPMYYRCFSNLNDTLDITIEVPEEDYLELKNRTVKAEGFELFLKNHYSSYDGFHSFTVNNLKDFETQEEWRCFYSVLNFYLIDTARHNQDEFMCNVYDTVVCNYPNKDEDYDE